MHVLGYAGAVDKRLKRVSCSLSQRSRTLPSRDQRVSTQLYYMLVLLLEGLEQRLPHASDGQGLLSCQRLVAEPETAKAGRETALLLEVLAQTFEGEGLDDVEVKIRWRDPARPRDYRSCPEKAFAVEDLKRHLLMHASRPSTYTLIREEVRSIVMARDTLSGPVPMDVSASYKGKGKGKEKGKGKANGRTRTRRLLRTLMQRWHAIAVTDIGSRTVGPWRTRPKRASP